MGTKVKVIAALVGVVVLFLVFKACSGGPASSLPEVDKGAVELPLCSANGDSSATKVTALKREGDHYVGVKLCIGLRESALTRLRSVGSVGIPAAHKTVFVVTDYDQNPFRIHICGVPDGTSLTKVQASEVVCPALASTGGAQ